MESIAEMGLRSQKNSREGLTLERNSREGLSWRRNGGEGCSAKEWRREVELEKEGCDRRLVGEGMSQRG